MTPDQFVDYKALVGDKSDNIPGVAGVGDKTAKKLLQQYMTLENIYTNLENVEPRFRNKLSKGRENAFLSNCVVFAMFVSHPKQWSYPKYTTENIDQ